MVHIAGDIEIGRPVDEVFEFVADARNEPRYNPQMRRAEKLSPGPIAVGTRFRSELVAMGRPVEAITEITGYDPPRRLASTSRLPTMEVWGSLTFDLIPGGTRLRWSWDLRPRGALKLMGPALGPVGRRREREVWEGLKRLLEARPAGPAG